VVPTASDRIYRGNSRWQRLSKAIRQQRRVCEHCHEALSEHVHHIKTLDERPDLAFDPANLLALCRPCHDRIHADRGDRPPPYPPNRHPPGP